MRELSLFSGAGGGLLGSLLLGWETVGYVEFNDYCQRVIAQRIRDGILPNAPIFGDIRAFISEGYAESYQGMVDVISGGFPCQPFSQAGNRLGEDDPRNMWPSTVDTIRAIRPQYCFFENVPGLLTSGYFERILCDLTESGYSVRWRCLSAAELGANHKRNRLWIVANANPEHGIGGGKSQQPFGNSGQTWAELGGSGSDVAYPDSQRQQKQRLSIADESQQPAIKCDGEGMADSASIGLQGSNIGECNGESRIEGAQPKLAGTGSGIGEWWKVEPDVGRVAHGVAHRLDFARTTTNGES